MLVRPGASSTGRRLSRISTTPSTSTSRTRTTATPTSRPTSGPTRTSRSSPTTRTRRSSSEIQSASLASGLVHPLIPGDAHAAPTVNRLRRARHRRAAHGLAAAISSSQVLTFLGLNRVRPSTAINYNERGDAFRQWVEEAQMPLDDASLLDNALCEYFERTLLRGVQPRRRGQAHRRPEVQLAAPHQRRAVAATYRVRVLPCGASDV